MKAWAVPIVLASALASAAPGADELLHRANELWEQGDRVHARIYYQLYLDRGGDDPATVALAQERIADVAREHRAVAVAPPAEPPPLERYPRTQILRPPTLVGGMSEPAAGTALIPRDEMTMTGTVTRYGIAGVLGGAYGVFDELEVGGEVDIDLGVTRRSLAWAHVAFELLDGPLAASVRASASYTFDPSGVVDARLAVPLRLRFTDSLAVISTEDPLIVTIAGGRRVLVRVPVGLAVQLGPSVFAWAGARFDVHGDATFAERVAGGLSVTPRADIDVVSEVHVLAAAVQAALLVRLRM